MKLLLVKLGSVLKYSSLLLFFMFEMLELYEFNNLFFISMFDKLFISFLLILLLLLMLVLKLLVLKLLVLKLLLLLVLKLLLVFFVALIENGFKLIGLIKEEEKKFFWLFEFILI